MSTRPTSESWQSRSTAPAPPSAPLAPHVLFIRDPEGDHYLAALGSYHGAPRRERHAAQADADALAAALAPLLGVAARVDALLANPDARDAVAGRCAAPASAALAVLRWVRSGGPPSGEGPATTAVGASVEAEGLRWGDAPTLDRAGCGMAVVAGEEGE